MKVFVDTSAWVAVMDKSDARHLEASEYHQKLILAKKPIITSDYVLSESFTRVRYDAGHPRAMKFHQLITEVERAGQLRIDWVNREIYKEAWEIFEKYSDQTFSFTDCTSFAIAKKAKIKEIFAFDEDFSVMGFVVLP